MQMSLSEISTIIPKALSDTRFVSCKAAALVVLTAYVLSKAGKETGLYYIDHTRHRSPMNFLVNLVGALAAYVWRPNKPAINVNKIQGDLCAVIQN